MKNFLFCLLLANFYLAPVQANQEKEAQSTFLYFIEEVEKDPSLSFEEQQDKIKEFKTVADNLSPETAAYLTTMILDETRSRIIDILLKAGLDEAEMDAHLADYEESILRVKNMSVEIARQMLFFVAELKIHRQLVYDFGVALGCPESQLLHHDLCKLSVDQFEGYARYFRGGRTEEDKIAYLAAWAIHQHEEHHHESYSKEGFDFDHFPEERLRNNMLESVSDLLASTKQRGGGTLIDWLINAYPKKNPHPRLIPYFKEALIKAHALYLQNDQDIPCWNADVENALNRIQNPSQ